MSHLSLLSFFEQKYVPRRMAAGSPASVADYRVQLNNLQAYFDFSSPEKRPLLVSDLSDDLLAGAMYWQLKRPIGERDGHSKASCNKLCRSISAIWRFAVDQELLAKPPKVEEYREDDLEPECWSPEEIDLILEHAAKERGRIGDVSAGIFMLALITFKYSVGVRISAVMQTPSKCLDLPAAMVKIPASVQKQKDDQRFDLIPQAVEALSLLRPERHACIFDDWGFDRSQPGWRALTKRLRRILRRANLPDTSRDLWHKIRRTTITFVAAKAGKAAAVEVAGHSHPSVTERYLDKRFLERVRLRDILPQPKVEIQLRLFRRDDSQPPQAAVG